MKKTESRFNQQSDAELSAKLARTAIILHENTAQGDKPSPEEIADWIEGRITGKRAAEIKSHIARDQECFDFFIELSELKREQGQEQADKMVRTALLLQPKPDDGPKPTVEVISDWVDGKLDRKTARRVKAWVARDSECFEIYQELLEVKEVWGNSQPERKSLLQKLVLVLKNSAGMPLFVGGSIAAIAATIFGVSLTLHLYATPDLMQQLDKSYANPAFGVSMQQSQWLWNPRLSSKASLSNEQQRYRQAFRSGIKDGLQAFVAEDQSWREVLQELPDQSNDCQSQICEQVQALGKWAVLMHAACKQAQTVPSAFWLTQRQWAEEWLSQAAEMTGIEPYQRKLRRYIEAGVEGSAKSCLRLVKLMSLGKP